MKQSYVAPAMKVRDIAEAEGMLAGSGEETLPIVTPTPSTPPETVGGGLAKEHPSVWDSKFDE
ncbi:MAG: hypothetical protein K6A82_05510 [Prevotella sp.]|nr:hypothetical protein [Prevotella sp.]